MESNNHLRDDGSVVNGEQVLQAEHASLLAKSPVSLSGPKTITTIYYAVALVMFLGLEEFVQRAPTIRLLEHAICHQHYASVGQDGPIQEDMCKLDSIQERLAFIQGWQGLFDALAAMLVAIPFSYLADKKGRRLVTFLSELGLILAMGWILLTCLRWDKVPIKAVWLSSVFKLIGGGTSNAFAMILTMAADVSTNDSRSKNFYKLLSAMLVTELLGPPISYWTMEKSLWLPLLICCLSLACSFPILWVMPETWKLKGDAHVDRISESATLVYKQIATDKRLILSMLALFVVQFRDQTIDVLLPYTSMRFGWSLSQTNSFLSALAIVNLILFLIVLPYTTTLLQKKTSLRTNHIDLLITRTSFILLMTGNIIMVVAWNSASVFLAFMVFATGFGARMSLMSIITTIVVPSHVARVYAVGSTVEKISQFISSPLVQSARSQGIAWEGGWRGFPFMIIALFFAFGTVCTVLIKPKELHLHEREEPSEDTSDDQGGD